jgi:hypothetical protein
MHQDMRLKFIIFLLFFSFIFFSSSILARESLPSRFSANAYTGVYTVGQADLMVSLDGDEQHNLYVDPQGAYGSDQQWYGDLGLGYRWINNDAAILGAYLFAGHSRVENSSGFWIVSPGVEALGSRWDARINAYIPVAGRSNEVGNVDFNIVSEPFFTGHTEVINSQFNVENEIQQIGNGADARVGYQFFRQVPLKGYIGTYFFGIANTNNVFGGAAGLEYWFDDNIRVFANYSYDNYQHSNVVGGLGISFGGVRKHWADPSLSERLTDPVDRYLANLGHGSGIPSKTLFYGMGNGSSTQVISNSIAFFSQTGTPNTGGIGLTLADCTFENPCGPTDFSNTAANTFNTLLPNTNFYFNGGSYTSGGVSLSPGQSIQSRTADYSQLATGSARSTITAQIGLSSNNTLENIIVLPGGSIGLFTHGSSNNNLIIGSQIGSLANPFANAIVDAGQNTVINNTEIFASSQAISTQNTNTTIQNSQINVDSGNSDGDGILTFGSNVLVSDTQIQVNGSGTATLVGLGTGGNSVITANNTTVTVVNTGGSGDATAFDETWRARSAVEEPAIGVR